MNPSKWRRATSFLRLCACLLLIAAVYTSGLQLGVSQARASSPVPVDPAQTVQLVTQVPVRVGSVQHNTMKRYCPQRLCLDATLVPNDIVPPQASTHIALWFGRTARADQRHDRVDTPPPQA